MSITVTKRDMMVRFILIILATVTTLSLAACTKHRGKPPGNASSGDSSVQSFDPKHTVALTIAKADPLTGDHWMARFERKQEQPDVFYEDDPWFIATYSENGALQDRLANRGFLLHLIDTLQTFHATGQLNAQITDPQSLNSYGLNPPRYALKWEVRNPKTHQSRSFEVEVGALVHPEDSASKESYGYFPPSTQILRIDGAALAMMDYVKNFSTLRHLALSPVSSDSIDQIEIERGRSSVFYAQRDGNHWGNKKHKPWKKDVQGFLDRITHLRIQSFVDSKQQSANLREILERHPLERIMLTDQTGKRTIFQFAHYKDQALAEVSTRPESVFVLYPTALNRLAP